MSRLGLRGRVTLATALVLAVGLALLTLGTNLLLAHQLNRDLASDGPIRRVGTVVVGESRVPYEHSERIALIATLLIDAFVLAAGVLLARRAVGKALQPVAEMTMRAAEWSEQDLDRRFDLGPPRDELTALSATLDRLLARIASSVRHEQRFSAEMAHELRTPLSGVRGEAELALRTAPAGEVRDSLEQILRGTDRMGSVIETLLSVARSDARSTAGSADAQAAVALAFDGLAQAGARNGGVRIESGPDAEGLRVGAEQDTVAQILRPVLENAQRHARTTVTVSISRQSGELLFVVADDGEGFGAAGAEALFEAGYSTVGSAGLGLALARRLARSCGGELTADTSGPGGRFVLSLPAVPEGVQGAGAPKRRSPA